MSVEDSHVIVAAKVRHRVATTRDHSGHRNKSPLRHESLNFIACGGLSVDEFLRCDDGFLSRLIDHAFKFNEVPKREIEKTKSGQVFKWCCLAEIRYTDVALAY